MKIKFIILIFFIISSYCFSQNQQAINQKANEINSQLTSYENGLFKVWYLMSIDSTGNTDYYLSLYIRDSSLFNCTIFLVNGPDLTTINHNSYAVGIYKNGDIKWISNSFSITDNYSAAHFISIADLNKDGTSDIAIAFGYGSRLQYEDWGLYSWNGNTGTVINAVDENSHTKIKMEVQSYNYVDINGDGILEIIGYHEAPYPNPGDTRSVFSWNGSKYGIWPNGPTLDNKLYSVANNLNVSVNCLVEKNIDTLIYNYKVYNHPDSKQIISDFYVKVNTDKFKINNLPYKWLGGSIDELSMGAFWIDTIFVEPYYMFYESSYLIGKGKELDSISLKSVSLPFISKYYVQAFHGYIDTTSRDDNTIINQSNQDILNNSVIGSTIAPSNPPSPFVPLNFLDTLLNFTSQSLQLGWVKNQAAADKYTNYFNTAKTQLQQNNITAVTNTLNQVLQDVEQDSSANLTSEAYALIKYNTEYLMDNLPQENSPSLFVKLTNSNGNLLTGGSLQYYEGSWKDAISYGDGTFGVNTDRTTISLSMTYEGGSQTIHNIPVGNDTAVFQTVNISVQLQNSQGNLIDTGTVQYYAGSWRDFGTTVNGTVQKELLPKEYSFSMTYEGASISKQRDIGTNPTVVFQTINATVQFQNSLGDLIDTGTVQYYSGSWRNLGTTVNGIAQKELLPKNYSFSMAYEGVSVSKQQNIVSNSTVIFSTVLCTVKVGDSQSQPIDGAEVSYYSGSWREIGQTVNGQVTKEMLPKNLTFKAEYNGTSENKTQDISDNSIIKIILP